MKIKETHLTNMLIKTNQMCKLNNFYGAFTKFCLLSIVEFAVAAWNGSITKAQISQLERIQKCALGIILGKEYVDYEAALNLVDLESLAVRRKSLCLKFAKKAANHPKFKHWFCKSQEKVVNTRSVQLKYVPVTSRTQRYEKSPLSYLTTLLNEN